MLKLGFIGAGKVGTALAVRVSEKGYPIVGIYDIKTEAAENFARVVKGCKVMSNKQDVADAADLVFITTTDDYIYQTATEISWRTGQMVSHCSGANTTALLEPARQAGAVTGVFHPGQAFTDKEQAIENIAGSTFDVEAYEPLLTTLKELAAALDSKWIEVKATDRPVYHVAEELSALFVYVNYKVATKMLGAINISEEEAKSVLLPLLKATTKNLEAFGMNQILPGPIDRGDAETVEKHMEGLKRSFPEGLPLYQELARQNVALALAWGSIDQKKAKDIKILIDQFK